MAFYYNALSQAFPPKPDFTEDQLADLHGKVYIVTGSNTGVGKELAQILYQKRARVYIAARSEEKAVNAIESIKQSTPDSAGKGELLFLRLDLADLTTIKASAQQFLSKESKLHVLFNNAGVMTPPQGSKTKQGHELQLGVNNIGTLMFTELVTPALVSTAKDEPSGSVRVVWVSSSAAEMASHKPGGVDMANLNYHVDKSPISKYGTSKAGNYLHAVEYANRHRKDGIVSVALNPGNLDSDLYRERAIAVRFVLQKTFLHPSIYGAYTELFAGLSPAVTMDKTGGWGMMQYIPIPCPKYAYDYIVVPWGRFMDVRKDLSMASKSEAEGGTGGAKRFTEWCEGQFKAYL